MSDAHLHGTLQGAKEVPIKEQLASIPSDARLMYNGDSYGMNIPIGSLAAKAVAEIERLEAAQSTNKFAPDWDGNKVLVERIRELEQEQDVLRHRLLEIMRRNGLATGHGDTLKQVIDTLEVELTDMLAKARQDAARYRWVRDHASRDWLDWGITDHDVDAAMQGDNNGTR